MTLNYLLYFCTPAKISIIFKYEHITPKKWMRLVKPKKALGQHFLKDLQIAERIADTLSDYKQLPVLEIGPGGRPPPFLLEKGHDLTVVELDMESVDYLATELSRLGRQDFGRRLSASGSRQVVSGPVLCDWQLSL